MPGKWRLGGLEEDKLISSQGVVFLGAFTKSDCHDAFG